MGSARIVLACGLGPLVGCVALSGAGDLHVDPCFDSCTDAAPSTEMITRNDAGAIVGTDGAVLSMDDGGPITTGDARLTLSGTGVAVGAVAVATLTARSGATVKLTASGGTSVLQLGAATDVGNGTYRALLTGVTEGTDLSIGATVDGVAITTPLPLLRVVNPVASGLTLSLDATDGTACATTWTDRSPSGFSGTLKAFAQPPCAVGSGWNGDGSPENPYRLSLDGADDEVSLGAVNSLLKQTVIAFVRKSGPGTLGETGTGGIGMIFPIIAKGSAENEMDAIDVNYFLGITAEGHLGVDFEQSNAPVSGNNPILGGTALADNAWYMLAFTLDSAASSRVLYVNGAPDGTSATANVPSAGTSSLLVIGGADKTTGAANGRFKGDIAIALTYGRALSASEIAQNCHAYSSRFGLLTCPR